MRDASGAAEMSSITNIRRHRRRTVYSFGRRRRSTVVIPGNYVQLPRDGGKFQKSEIKNKRRILGYFASFHAYYKILVLVLLIPEYFNKILFILKYI